MTIRIEIPIEDAELAARYERMNLNQRQQFQQVILQTLATWESQHQTRLDQMIIDLSLKAQANGMTEAILDQLLNGDDE